MKSWEIARLIEHTMLKAEARPADIQRLCQEALEYGFYGVCVNPWLVPTAVKELLGTEIKVVTVVGFPLGATTTGVKAGEAQEAVANGAQEVDMVINLGALKAGRKELVVEDISQVVAAVAGKALVKVIIETGLLTREEKEEACRAAVAGGAAMVKTSTGFGPGGALPSDVSLMRAVVGPELGIKASGGIRSLALLKELVQAGATRIGTSSGVKIMGTQGDGSSVSPCVPCPSGWPGNGER